MGFSEEYSLKKSTSSDFTSFVYFYGINPESSYDSRLPVWSQWMWSWEGMCPMSSQQPELPGVPCAPIPWAQQAGRNMEEQKFCSAILPRRAPPFSFIYIHTLVCLQLLLLASDHQILTLRKESSADITVRSLPCFWGSLLVLWCC